MWPSGCEPSLPVVADFQARLTCVFGLADPLIPAKNREPIGNALQKNYPVSQRPRFVEYDVADHGLTCEVRSSFHLKASP